MFSKITNLPRGVALFLDALVILGIGIFAAVSVTVWIAKRYGKKMENNKNERKIMQFKQCLEWLKLLIAKELYNTNSMLSYLEGDSKNDSSKKITMSYFMAINQIIEDMGKLQIDFLSNFSGHRKNITNASDIEQQSTTKESLDENLNFIDDTMYEKILENCFCKFALGYYFKLFMSMQQVATEIEIVELFTEEEKEVLNHVIHALEKITSQQESKRKSEFLEIKKRFWIELVTFIEEFQLQDCLEESIESVLYL